MENRETEIFKQLLSDIGQNHDKLLDRPLTGFLPLAGNQYLGKLMVVGKSVNGWTNDWLPSEMVNDLKIKEIAKQAFSPFQDTNRCPMLWVADAWGNKVGYNTKKSALWRVIRRVVGRLNLANIEDLNWPSVLVWSNLYKVSPAEGDNPSLSLRNQQLNHCQQLHNLELDRWAPEKILYLTGFDWAEPFLSDRIDQIKKTPSKAFVKATAMATYSDSKSGRIVIAAHPQGKNETIWINEVIESFEIIET